MNLRCHTCMCHRAEDHSASCSLNSSIVRAVATSWPVTTLVFSMAPEMSVEVVLSSPKADNPFLGCAKKCDASPEEPSCNCSCSDSLEQNRFPLHPRSCKEPLYLLSLNSYIVVIKFKMETVPLVLASIRKGKMHIPDSSPSRMKTLSPFHRERKVFQFKVLALVF